MNRSRTQDERGDLKRDGSLIVQVRTPFAENDLLKAQMTSMPLEDHSLDKYRLSLREL